MVMMTAQDIDYSGCRPTDRAVRRMEHIWDHRVAARLGMLNYISEGSVGAEFGVYTGLFSAMLASEKKITRVTFVDPWWERMGEHYPEYWGAYSDNGRVSTRAAYEIACQRINRPGLPGRHVEVAFAQDWLAQQPDKSLDWVYVDCALERSELYQILIMLDRKLRLDKGVILGDDWWADGVFIAVNDFIKAHRWDLIFADGGGPSQYMLRRAYPDRHLKYPASNQLRRDIGYDVFGIQWEGKE